MKKFLRSFAMLALILMGSTAQAETETVFAADVTATSSVFFGTGTTEITSEHATLVGGKMYAISKQAAEKELIKKQGSNYHFCFTNNDTFFEVELDKALAVGDVISTKGYSNKDAAVGVWVSTATPRPNTCSSALEDYHRRIRYRH